MDILSEGQIQNKLEFLNNYAKAINPATASVVDANSNVTEKSLATAYAELYKDYNIQLNRKLSYDKIKELYGQELADKYLDDLNNHLIYVQDESSLFTYCCSISLYPFLIYGTKCLGGVSDPPKNLQSFCGSFVNCVYQVASSFAGACLYKNQHIIVQNNNKTKAVRVKDLVNSFALDKQFSNYQGDWEYADVNSDLFVYENGKNVKITKVYRRKYDDSIYVVKTKSGKTIKCSKDHKFKVLLRGRYVTLTADELQLYDTVVNTANSFNVDFDNDDYKLGQFIGVVAGDGNITQDAYCRIAYGKMKRESILPIISYFVEKYAKDNTNKEYDRNSYFEYTIYGKEIVDTIREYFVGDNYSSYDKYIDIDKYSLEFLLGFVDGLMITDGGYNNSLALSLANINLVNNVRDIISNLFGEQINITKVDAHNNKKEIYSIYIPIKYKRFLSATQIRRKQNKKFVNAIYGDVSYIGKYALNSSCRYDYITQSHTKYESDDIFDVIVSIDKIENDDDYVYEIETESHWYSASGILTHNCATVEFLHVFDYFARKQYGKDYLETHTKEISQELQGVVYALNQPASARGNQSVFWNISVFDKYYMESMFGDFFYPDGTQIDFESVRKLQEFFMEWFRKEREKSLLTFPVLTASCLEKEDKSGFKDEEFIDFLCNEMEKGLSFFIYESTSADSLSSCCRLKNEITENDFSYTLGAGGVMTGSVKVITLNANRLVQQYGLDELEPLIHRMHKYLTAYREIYKKYIDQKMLPPYTAGFITLDKQFITIGVNGIVEAAEYLGYEISPNKQYKDFCAKFLGKIKTLNTEYKLQTGIKVNTECVPAENLGVKNAKWDKKDGLKVNRDCYNSYFYIVEDENSTILDKFNLHGRDITDYLDGGSALHMNLGHLPSKEQAKKLFNIAMKNGVPYWTFNCKMTCCNDCGYIDVNTETRCKKCGSTNIDYATRVIGYLKKISNFSEKRQEEAERRFYA